MELKTPKTNTQEVLYVLIKKGHVSLFDFPYLPGFRTRVSELKRKHNIPLQRIEDLRHNKFGNIYTYIVHKLKDKDKALKVYQEMTK